MEMNVDIPNDRLLNVIYYDEMNKKKLSLYNVYYKGKSKRFIIFQDYNYNRIPIIELPLILTIHRSKYNHKTDKYINGETIYKNINNSYGIDL